MARTRIKSIAKLPKDVKNNKQLSICKTNVGRKALELDLRGYQPHEIVEKLNAEGFRMPNGKEITESFVKKELAIATSYTWDRLIHKKEEQQIRAYYELEHIKKLSIESNDLKTALRSVESKIFLLGLAKEREKDAGNTTINMPIDLGTQGRTIIDVLKKSFGGTTININGSNSRDGENVVNEDIVDADFSMVPAAETKNGDGV